MSNARKLGNIPSYSSNNVGKILSVGEDLELSWIEKPAGSDPAAANTANSALLIAVSAYDQANAAFEKANTTDPSVANTANSALVIAGNAYDQANLAFVMAKMAVMRL